MQMKWGRHILDAFHNIAVLRGEYCKQNKLLPCRYPAVLMLDGCMQGGIFDNSHHSRFFLFRKLNKYLLCSSKCQGSIFLREPKNITSHIFCALPYAIIFLISVSTCACICGSNYISCLSPCVHVSAWIRFRAYADCGSSR